MNDQIPESIAPEPRPTSDKWRKMLSKHDCVECGRGSVYLSNEGFVCEDHRPPQPPEVPPVVSRREKWERFRRRHLWL